VTTTKHAVSTAAEGASTLAGVFAAQRAAFAAQPFPDLAARRDGQHAVEPPRLRGLGNGRAAVQHVDHRPAPDIRQPADGLGVFRVHEDAGRWRGHVGRSPGQRNLPGGRGSPG